MTTKQNGKAKQESRFTMNQVMEQLIENATYSLTSRSRLASAFTDPRRSMADECGYPTTESLTVEQYQEMYDREPVATRVVEILPLESWMTQPTIYEDEDGDNVTDFEEAWDQLGKDLCGAGYYATEEGSPVWEYLLRADILSGIGSFGALLLGVDDGKEMSEPAEGIDDKGMKSGNPKEKKLLYLRALGESSVQVTAYERDQRNPRYGRPTQYSVTMNNQTELSSSLQSSFQDQRTLQVHWSRIIHVADNLSSSDIFGIPRQRPVFNRLCDIQKVCGGSGEMYYKGAFPGWNLEMDPNIVLAGSKVKIDESDIKDQIEQWQNGLQRILYMRGLTMKSLGTQVVDPTPQLMMYIKMICIKLAIPERIFMGSERGELASSQDAGAWNSRMMHRQRTYLTPRLIVPFVDRLILLGVLPEPEEYMVKWPDLGALTDLEKAQLALTRIDAITKYIQGNGEALIQPVDFLTRVLPYDEEEAQEMIDGTMDRIEEEDSGASPLLGMVGGITGMTQLFQQFKDGVIGEETLKQQIMLFFKVDEEKAQAIIADGLPEQPEPPPSPVKVKEGETLVNPDGTPVAGKNPFAAKKPNPFAKGAKPGV